jgi:hypothetical protein
MLRRGQRGVLSWLSAAPDSSDRHPKPSSQNMRTGRRRERRRSVATWTSGRFAGCGEWQQDTLTPDGTSRIDITPQDFRSFAKPDQSWLFGTTGPYLIETNRSDRLMIRLLRVDCCPGCKFTENGARIDRFINLRRLDEHRCTHFHITSRLCRWTSDM